MNSFCDLSIRQPRSAKILLRLALPALAATVFLGFPAAFPALAQGTGQANTPESSAIDPAAMDALDKMGIYLRTLHSFQVTAAITTDDVTDDGQIIESSKKINLLAARPNRMRVEINSDDEHRFLFFNGKDFTIYGQLVNYYATVPAPATIGELIQRVNDRYGIELPLVDLFTWGTDDTKISRITSAIDVGPSTVEDVTCEQYAFRQEGLDWQLWIQLGEFPLPRKLVIRTLTDDAKPQHSEVLTWNLAPSFSENAFTFNPPAGAQRISIATGKDAMSEQTSK